MVSGNGLQGFITSGSPYSDTFIFQNMHFIMPNEKMCIRDSGKRVYVITATHDYTTPRMPTYGLDKTDKYIEVESVKRTQLLK